jgi:hypothetical protein
MAFSRALQRVTNVLTHHPELLWQQVYNHLHWEYGTVKTQISSEWKHRSQAVFSPNHIYLHRCVNLSLREIYRDFWILPNSQLIMRWDFQEPGNGT